MSSRLSSLAEVIGGNCRRIRTINGLSQNELARYGRDVGLRWNAAKVGDFEAGRSAPTLATVLGATLALQMAVQARRRAGNPDISDVKLEDLFSGAGFVAVNDSLDISALDLRAVCSGDTFDPDGPGIKSRPLSSPAASTIKSDAAGGVRISKNVRAVLQRSGLTEDRVAQRLKERFPSVTPLRMAEESFRLWRSTFSEERDRRAGQAANPQKRGRVSREMRTELEEAIADGDN